MNPGPMDQRGGYSPELATVSWRDVIRKGWLKRPEKVPPFWRSAVQRCIAEREGLMAAQELRQRSGNGSPELEEARRQWNEARLRERFPGWS